jgi:pilus assembly protein CpaF
VTTATDPADPRPGDSELDVVGAESTRLSRLPLFAIPAPPAARAASVEAGASTNVRGRAEDRPSVLAETLAHRLAHPINTGPVQPVSGTTGDVPVAVFTPLPASNLPEGSWSEVSQAPSATTRPIERPVATSDVDWAQVRAFRQQAADLLTAQLRDRPGLDEPGRREIGRALIMAMLRDHADDLLAGGGPPPTPEQEQLLAAAVFDALFGLGRLQSLVDNVDVENVEITGCEPVYLDFGDGRIECVPAVADSDEELIETLAFLAARSGGVAGGGERAFSPSAPFLDLTLHGGARLAARAWITPRPTVVIRRHRFTDVDLADLKRLGMLDGALQALLGAAMRANKTIVISGAQGAGKTTLARALCNELDPWERIGTIETEYELLLHTMPERHRRIVAHEARPGTGERSPDGRAAGEITLDDLLYGALRLNLSRIVVGEVRGREILPMIKAAQAGSGTLSTVHAHSARAAIERLVTCALEAGPHVTQDYAYLQIASHIDLIVQLDVQHAHAHGRKYRYIREVIEVGRGEAGRPAITDVFAPGPDGRAVPRTRPSFLADLERCGFDTAWLDQTAGTWPTFPASADGPSLRGLT